MSSDDHGRKKPGEVQSQEIFDVLVTMQIGKDGKEVEKKTIDFGKISADQLRGLTDIFSMIASNVEYIRKLAPQYEKLDKSKPSYLT